MVFLRNIKEEVIIMAVERKFSVGDIVTKNFNGDYVKWDTVNTLMGFLTVKEIRENFQLEAILPPNLWGDNDRVYKKTPKHPSPLKIMDECQCLKCRFMEERITNDDLVCKEKFYFVLSQLVPYIRKMNDCDCFQPSKEYLDWREKNGVMVNNVLL
jgi:hypothetical protein